MAKPEQKAPVWYLAGPFYRYEQDVKSLAKKAGVRIIDATVTDDRSNAADDKDLPRVTLKAEYRPVKVKAEKEKELTPEEQAAADAAKALMQNGGK